jgi:putative ABC transport system substrate-binding protein
VRGTGAATLALVAGCGRLPFQAQPPPKLPRIGWLWNFAPETNLSLRDGFIQGLRDYGYVDGQNVVIDFRESGGNADLLQDLAADIVRLGPDVIVGSSLPVTQAVKNATATIPIVSVVTTDPVGAGLVASLARPGGNVTGMVPLTLELSAKRLELLKEVAPQTGRVAVLWNADNPDKASEYRYAETAARTLGLELQSVAVRRAEDFESAFEALRGERIEGLIVFEDGLTGSYKPDTVAFAARNHLPAVYTTSGYVTIGGLMSYGPNFPAMFRRAAYYVDRILKGSKPADLPMEQPTTFDFVLNLKTAQALGLTIPQHILLQTTEVIQ